MKQPLLQTLKNRWFAGFIHAGIWVLVLLAAIGLTGKMPDVHEEEAFSAPAQDPVPVGKLNQLLAPGAWPKLTLDSNHAGAFFTRHFVPPPVQTPPVPTTKKFELTYQGFYQAADSIPQTIIKIGDAFVVRPVGARVISNLFVGGVSFQALVLTNEASQTNILLLNTKKEVEVPIK